MRRSRLYLLVLVIGVILVVASALLIKGNRAAPTDAGTLPSASPAAASTGTVPVSPSAPAGASAATHTFVAPGATGTSVPINTKAGTPAPLRPQSSVAGTPRVTSSPSSTATAGPAELRLPTLQVVAEVNPVVSVDGVLQVPDDISRVGWWKHSVPPGSGSGSTVIDGHIDSAVAGKGALFNLGNLGPGDPVSVLTKDGRTVDYRVQARRVYAKAQGLPADLFTQTGPARLVIISCGGAFDTATRNYEENIAVFAVPVPQTG